MKIERSKEWWAKKLASEGDSPIEAGMLPRATKPPRKELRPGLLETWGTGLGIQCKDADGGNSILVMSPDRAVRLGQKLIEEATKLAFESVRRERVASREKRRKR